MRLRDTVKRFASEEYRDAFSTKTFKGHMAPFNEVANSGVAAQRRILEVFPETVIPASRVVFDTTGRYYIVALKNKDFWAGQEIRDKYPVIISSGTGAVGTIGQILAGTATSNIHTFPYLTRREIADDDMSDYLPGYEVFFPNIFTFARGHVLSFGGRYYRLVTDTWLDGAGFTAAQAIEVENAVQSLSVVPAVQTGYDPVTDSYSTEAPIQVSVFIELMSKDYEFDNLAFARIKAGDKAISALKTATDLKPNYTIGNFRVISVKDMGDFNTAHCRYLGS